MQGRSSLKMADKEKPSEKGTGKRASRVRSAEAGTRPPRPPKGPKVKGQGGNGAARPESKAAPVASEQVVRARGWMERFRKYLKAVQSEFKRITWPTKQELRAATIVVVATLIVVTFYLWVVDNVIGIVFQRLGHY